MGTGVAAMVGRPFSGMPASVSFASVKVPFLSELPILGPALFSQNVLVYFAFILLPLAVHVLLFRTRHGLNMRAVGENPAAADTIGIPVLAMRFWYVCVGAMFASAAGAYLTLAFIPSWSEGMVAGRGWIAAALVIFARYRPVSVVFCALLFGLITAVGYVGQARNWPIAAPLLGMLPYLGTLALIMVPAFVWRRQRAATAALTSLCPQYDRHVATPAEARAILGLRP
jgi:simple sugar transport system permease protein